MRFVFDFPLVVLATKSCCCTVDVIGSLASVSGVGGNILAADALLDVVSWFVPRGQLRPAHIPFLA